ncbi:acetoacetate decarboxylase family protein [Streptomyces sp. HUAS TT7]|uniref:acetoacetate decarboxylase family protein n=1 Tax=Streptomyces sp. HUAS TT7 TaxID=3447507 RepID=UPI003F658008
MSSVRGYFHPKTATGESSIAPAPPWLYSGDVLTVEYRTDPERVRELLPHPLELAPEDPGAVALVWADWQSCSASKRELLDPVRAQYKEAFAVVRCSYRGQAYSRCVYIWVDKDFAVVRGFHQGYPKKLGSIHQTRPHPFGPAPRIEPGARFGATLAAADRRLAQVVVTLRQPSTTGGFVNAHPMAHHRWLPSIEKGKGLALDELIESGTASFEAGQAWAGDADLELFDSPTEELARLVVREPIAAYYRQVGVVWDGGRLLESNTSGAE